MADPHGVFWKNARYTTPNERLSFLHSTHHSHNFTMPRIPLTCTERSIQLVSSIPSRNLASLHIMAL